MNTALGIETLKHLEENFRQKQPNSDAKWEKAVTKDHTCVLSEQAGLPQQEVDEGWYKAWAAQAPRGQ